MRIVVDRDRCCGIGNCTMAAPAVFDQNEHDGTVIVLQLSPAAEFHELVRRAESVCPCEAIRIEDE
jgi:ferredoxin